MKQVDILEMTDVQEAINAAVTPIVDWTNLTGATINSLIDSVANLTTSVSQIVEVNKSQGKRINAQADRITALEEKLASSDVFNDGYSDTY